MSQVINLYRNAFGGLSQASWMLALIMFVNRAGAMVVPFLSVYLTEAMGFKLKDAGIIMSIFGLGATCGAFMGGWLTDKIGHFKVQLGSLFLSSGMFLVMLQLQTFESIAVGIFFLSLVAECLRPANASSVSYYAKPENVTRAFSLNRMASNLGFSIGPALGGLLASISYRWLFVGDAITCFSAGIFFYFYFRSRRGFKQQKPAVSENTNLNSAENTPENAIENAREKGQKTTKVRSPYTDVKFVLFALLSCMFATTFFQFFTTLPIYYRQVYELSESGIGLLLALNGLLVFSLEMVVVYLIGDKFKLGHLMALGTLIMGFSFVILNLFESHFILYVAMAILSVSEILAMPFMATITVQRSNNFNRGSYMGLYTLSYSAAHVISPYLGTNIIADFGFETLWYVLGGMSVVAAAGFYFLVPKLQAEAAG
ncbi:MFS transporter [Adhaeribacter sp. BT258]|uniref:MFS transporter n=1 Tax=Adhaeribacter terrigena TaxID=2793070 RepID=A0ABS1C6S1_9BACT|nr:MFS transporter [Adhaeribacter terrigena]MBK0404872.1 MFS transporter [Adhaeribacter terrigena]